jgi:hypothetical protein
MLMYKEPKMQDTSQNISQTYWTLNYWAGLKELVSDTVQYSDPLLPLPPKDEYKAFEMLWYR